MLTDVDREPRRVATGVAIVLAVVAGAAMVLGAANAEDLSVMTPPVDYDLPYPSQEPKPRSPTATPT